MFAFYTFSLLNFHFIILTFWYFTKFEKHILGSNTIGQIGT